MNSIDVNIEFLKISARAFKLAVLYSGDVKNDYIKTLQTYLSVPNLNNEVKHLIEQEIEFFEQS